jgi:2'-5' RNA ligase
MSEQFSFQFGAASPPDPFFFALRPAAASAQTMTELATTCCERYGLSERPYNEGRLHLSLAAVISRRGPRKGDLEAALRAAARVRLSPFPVAFNRVRTFHIRRDKRPTVLCCCAGAEELTDLRDALRRALTREGLWRGPAGFEPHVTLVWGRGSVPSSSLEEPIGWTVEDFVLLQTVYGKGRQIERGRWLLRA